MTLRPNTAAKAAETRLNLALQQQTSLGREAFDALCSAPGLYSGCVNFRKKAVSRHRHTPFGQCNCGLSSGWVMTGMRLTHFILRRLHSHNHKADTKGFLSHQTKMPSRHATHDSSTVSVRAQISSSLPLWLIIFPYLCGPVAVHVAWLSRSFGCLKIMSSPWRRGMGRGKSMALKG